MIKQKKTNPKTKTHTFWCVVSENGMPVMQSNAVTKEMAIFKHTSGSILVWNKLKFAGYTCQKFTIKTKIK